MSQSLNIYMSMVLILIFKIDMVRFIYYNRITLANIISIDTETDEFEGEGKFNNIKIVQQYQINIYL